MVQLKRIYYKDRTEGVITLPDGQELATLERPWLDNSVDISCIPEGQYVIIRDHYGIHRWYTVSNVHNRTFIEIHPANKVSQLAGCIAPCMFIKDGIGYDSMVACELLLEWFGENNWVLEIRS